jgi:phage I-like protein
MLVTALDFSLPEEGSTASIVYIPEGKHTITPCVDGKPKKVTIKMEASHGEKIAAGFQKLLEQRLSANVRPTFDFDHKDTGPASALPKRFFYEQGRGLMAEIEWTGAGRRAIESKDYSYFSPTFLLDDNGVPAGIPERGPLGALVNEPAFRDIPRIAASDATPDQPEKKEPTMSKLIFAALNINAADADAEQTALTKIEAMKSGSSKLEELNSKIVALTKERDEMKNSYEKAKAANQEAKELHADGLIKAACADGRIAPKDEDTKQFWKDLVVEKGDSAIKALDALPKKHEGITDPVVKASGEKQTGGKGSLIAAADALVKAGTCANQDEAIAQVAADNPELYEAYRDSLGDE